MARTHNDLTTSRVMLARWMYANREHRPLGKVPEIHREPGWDMLLDLYVNQTMGRRIAVTAACVASRAPFTTALRHIKQMCATGVMRRVPDESDRRRLWLELSEETMKSMSDYLDRSLNEVSRVLGAWAVKADT